MAAKAVNKPAVIRKTTRLPSKMAARNVEVRPVGAWVQPEYGNYSDAVVSAQYEEERMQRQQAEKEARLKQFQEEVKRRVTLLEQLKRQQMLEKSYRAVELEQSVVGQSVRSAEKTTSRQNRCELRDLSDDAIKRSSGYTYRHGSFKAAVREEEAQNKAFEQQSNKVHSCTSEARRHLISRRIMMENYTADDLPGGIWKTGATRDNPAAREASGVWTDPDNTVNEDNNIEQVRLENCQGSEKENTQPKMVHFDLDPDTQDPRRDRISTKSPTTILGDQIERVPSAPNIYPGVQTEEEKQRAVMQRAMYRRLFMDIEREQVKENQRRKEHRKRIHSLKREKEEERQRVEDEAFDITAAKDPVTGETEEESMRREQEEEQSIREHIEQERQKQQKTRDMERYLDALKRNLREKIEKQGIDLPPMCCCGVTVWDTNPETCANNCYFYKNPKAYGRALQSLLASCDVV